MKCVEEGGGGGKRERERERERERGQEHGDIEHMLN